MRAHLFYSVAGLAVSAAGVLAGDAALYMYPAAPGPGRPARVSPAQANRILSHHLDVPGEHLTQGAHDRDSWDFLQVESNSGTAQDLFDDAKNRLVVVVHGAEDAGDVAPSSLRQTHSMPSAPPAHSFDALIHSYGERLHSSLGLGQHKGFLGQSVEAIEEAAEWFAEKVMPPAKHEFKKVLDVFDLSDKSVATFHRELSDYVSSFDSYLSGHSHASEPKTQYQSLRFQGLDDIHATYGAQSEQYKQAVAALRAVLEATIAKFESHASTTGRRPALALIVTPPSSSLPALNRRSDDPLAAFRTAPRIVAAGPVLNERDFVGKCFANEKDLVNATSNCLGRGTPHLSTKGARRCYICQCKPTTDGNQKTYWSGEACQKEDISGPFVLLSVTSLVLLLIIIGSVGLLFKEGQKELPGTLAGVSLVTKGL